MNRKKSLPIAIRIVKLIFLILFLVSVYAYIKPFTTADYKTTQSLEKQEFQSFGFLDKNQIHAFNNKTPRNLFTNFYYKSLSLWMGYHRYYYDVVDSITPQSVKLNDYTISEQDINIDKMLVAMLKTNFRFKDIPENTTADRLDLTLGKDQDKQTFYIAKNKDGNWYFTEQNFNSSDTLKKLKDYVNEKNLGEDNIRNISMPILSYMKFVFGVTGEYNFNINDATNIMDTKWIPKSIRHEYASFIAFSMNKVFENAKISIRDIPGEVLPGSNLVMIHTSPISGKSIYLENKQLKKSDNNRFDNWIFPKSAEIDGVNIFLNDLSNNLRDPLSYSLNYTIWENIPSMLNKYGQNTYILIVCIIFLGLLLLGYKLLFTTLNPILKAICNIFESKDFKTIRKLNIATSLIISMYIAFFFLFNSIIFFEHTCYYFNLIFRIIFGVLLIFLLNEIVNVLCSFIISFYKRAHDTDKSARFAFGLIICNKIINLLIIIIITGYVIEKLGIDMFHFLAALGIGGIAIALAGKDTIENLFGSIILAAERPIKIGDWVIIENKQGVVEKIGLRSTVIRTFEDSCLTIPNYSFVTSKIDNMGDRKYRRYMTMLEVDESTPTKKLKGFTTALHEIVQNAPNMKKYDYYIRVNDLKPSSIEILIYVFFISETWGEELKQREEFIIKMLETAESMGIKLAPSQRVQFESIEDCSQEYNQNASK